MHNRGMIDDVIVVGTGLLLALLLCGGLVVYEERKDRTGAVSPIYVWSVGQACLEELRYTRGVP